MTNRQLVAVGVVGVGLFVALAYAALGLDADEPAHESNVAAEVPRTGAPVPPVVTAHDAGLPARSQKLQLSADAGAPIVPSPPEISNVDGEDTLTDSQVAPAVAQVRRMVAQCSADVATRYRAAHEVTVSFILRADGERAGVDGRPIVEKSSLQDPYFQACVEDAPLDVGYALRAVGAAKVRLRYP